MKLFNKALLLFGFLIPFVISGCGNSLNDAPPEAEIPNPEDGTTLSFTLLQTTDVHHRAGGTGASQTYSPTDGNDGTLDDSDLTQGGYARLTTKIAQIRMQKAYGDPDNFIPTVLVDSGDFIMGTVYDMTLGSSPAAFNFMESMKYDAITLGNHEFDYGPLGLAMFFNMARGEDGSGFTIPVVATNMVTDGETGTDDDGIEALVAAEAIRKTYTKPLDNGLKIGFLGLLGKDANADAPLATPVTFLNDFDSPDLTAHVDFIQEQVDYLKNTVGVDVVIAISHSGISDTDPSDPEGDDITLAQKVTGIDIIASGHEHDKTDELIEVVNGDHTTYIFCAGHYGKYLAQLDVTVTKGSGITSVPTLVNHTIDDSVTGNNATQFMNGLFEAGINQALAAEGLSVQATVGGTDSTNIGKPRLPDESGMGNLIADSLRYLLLGGVLEETIQTPTIGMIANGVVRNGFDASQQISFADLYSVLPLGMTLDETQQDVPGYPLVTVWLTGKELWHMCQFLSYIIAAGDTDFVNSLPTLAGAYSGAAEDATEMAGNLNDDEPTAAAAYATVQAMAGSSPFDEAIAAYNAVTGGGGTAIQGYQAAAQVFTAAATQATMASNLCSGLDDAMPHLDSEYFMNLSGVQYTTAKGSTGLYQVQSVNLYNSLDGTCSGGLEVTAIEKDEEDKLYPCVLDIYVVMIMLSPDMMKLLSVDEGFGIPIYPKLADGSLIAGVEDIMSARIDSDPTTVGIQEVKEWQALLMYLTSAEDMGGLNGVIPDVVYGTDALSTGNSSRVNVIEP